MKSLVQNLFPCEHFYYILLIYTVKDDFFAICKTSFTLYKDSMTCILDTWLATKLGLKETHTLPEELKKEQWKRIRTTLQHAAGNSSLYAKRLCGHDIAHITTENFVHIPFTTAEDVQQWERLLCVSQSRITRMVTLQTSGTSAPPKRLAFSLEDLEATKDFFTVGMSPFMQRGHRLLILLPGAARPHGLFSLLQEALTARGIEVFAGEPRTTEESLLHELHVYTPHLIIASPRQLTLLANILDKNRSHTWPLHTIYSGAEYLAPELEQRLQTHNLVVFDHYGTTETCYGGGVECLHKNGYHLRELDLFIEIVHPMSLQALPHGHEGEIVLTTLTRQVMPLIRYRTGDVGRMLPPPCACGSPLSRLERIHGRLVYTKHGFTIQHAQKGAFYERTAHATL